MKLFFEIGLLFLITIGVIFWVEEIANKHEGGM